MRSVVALLDTRPGSILEDYARLFALAGLDAAAAAAPALVAAASTEPGLGCPPWQLAAAMKAAPGAFVLPVGGPVPPAWRNLLAQAGAAVATPEQASPSRVHPGVAVPCLQAVLREAPAVPAGLQAGGALMLASPAVGRGWPVEGAVALLLRLLAPAPVRPRRFPLAELAAEAAALAREALRPAGAVLDGTVWHVDEGGLTRGPVARGVILAGRDPVAVDAVACRLAGADPRRVPWLRLCTERGVGEGRPDRIDVRGQVELLDLDISLPQSTLSAAERLPGRRPAADLVHRLVCRPGVRREHRDTPWGRLAETFTAERKAQR